jgi:DNA-binding NtrC family response regulator
MISNDFDRFLLLGLLKQLNCSYTETYDGSHLLNILQKSNDYQMVLIDSNLQIAQYLVHQVRQKSQIPITCIVDGADSEYAKQFMQYGNTEMLIKPPTVNSLSKILKRFLRG